MICKTDRQSKRSRAKQESVQSAAGAHPVAREEWMGRLCPYQIVAPIVCRPDDQVVRVEHCERVLKNRTRQMRAVAVEGDHVLLILCEVRKHRTQAGCKPLTLLLN